MNAVLDTNVLVSGMLTRDGTCSRILNLLVEGRITLFLDERMLAEYRRVCTAPRLHLDAVAVEDFLRFLSRTAEKVVATPLQVDLPDEDDLPFLEVAAEARAVLVTGNARHFPKPLTGAVQVASPRDFLDFLRSRTGP